METRKDKEGQGSIKTERKTTQVEILYVHHSWCYLYNTELQQPIAIAQLQQVGMLETISQYFLIQIIRQPERTRTSALTVKKMQYLQHTVGTQVSNTSIIIIDILIINNAMSLMT